MTKQINIKVLLFFILTGVLLWFILGNIKFNFIISEILFVFLSIFHLLILSILKIVKEQKIKLALDFNLLITSLVLFNVSWTYYNELNIWFYNQYMEIGYTLILKLFLLIILILILVLSRVYIKYVKIVEYEFSFLMILSAVGMMLLISSENFVLFYLAIELMTLPLYILSAFKTDKIYSAEAGLKYFIVGSVSSGLILFGISFIYGATGLISFKDIGLFFLTLSTELNLSLIAGGDSFFCFYFGLIGILFIFIGFFLKLGIVPFHFWIPDVYEGAPLIITLFLSTLPKVCLIAIMVKFFFLFSIYLIFLQKLLIYLGLITIIVGALGALVQLKIKRLLAFSAINHMGYIFIMLGLFNEFGLVSIFIYLFIYILTIIGFFAILIGLREYSLNLDLMSILQLKGIGRKQPIIGLSLSLLLFSFAGIPPLSGFFTKILVLYNLLGLNYLWFSFFILLTTVFSTFYYIRIVSLLFFYNQEENMIFLRGISRECLIICYLALIGCFFFFIFNGLSSQLITSAIESLFLFEVFI